MKKIDEQNLDAYVDGELDQSGRGDVLQAMADSSEVGNRIAEIRHLKDLVRLAYRDIKPNPAPQKARPGRYATHATAAAIGALGMLALIEASILPETFESSSPGQSPGKVVDDRNRAERAMRKPEQVLFHLSNNDYRTATELLDQVELVATRYAEIKRKIRIIVLTNNDGLRIFMAGRSEHAQRIRELYQHFDNIVFAACGATLSKQAGAGEDIELLPEVIVVDSGVAEITRRQSEGWKYIRI